MELASEVVHDAAVAVQETLVVQVVSATADLVELAFAADELVFAADELAFAADELAYLH